MDLQLLTEENANVKFENQNLHQELLHTQKSKCTPLRTEENRGKRSTLHSGLAYQDTSLYNPVDTPKESVRRVPEHQNMVSANFNDQQCDLRTDKIQGNHE